MLKPNNRPMDSAPGAAGGTAPVPTAVAPAVAAPTPAPAPAPAAPASLLQPPPVGTPAPAPGEPVVAAPAPAVSSSKIPEKYHVKTADGALDMEATLAKFSDGYGHLAKRFGGGDVPPETSDAYALNLPEVAKDVKVDDAMLGQLREKAHKAGMTQAQFDLMTGEFFTVVPEVLKGALQLSEVEAREALGKVWQTPDAFKKGLDGAQRAINAAPEGIRQQVFERFGRDPLFLQFAAAYGAETREDRTPSASGNTVSQTEVDSLLVSEAFRNPKHPGHAEASAKFQKWAQSQVPGGGYVE